MSPSHKPARKKIIWLKASECHIHPVAQRRLVPAQLNKRMADLDLDAIGVLAGIRVSETTALVDEDGKEHTLVPGVYIIDGQHRITALRKHDFGDWVVAIEIHEEVKDLAGAHHLFLQLQARSPVSSFDTFLNELGAGRPSAVGSKRIAGLYGLEISRQSGDEHISCVSTLKSVYEIDEGRTLTDTLLLVTSAYGHVASAMEGKLIEGLAIVVSKFNGEIDQPAMIKKLAKYPGGASGILGDAKGLKKIRRSSVGRCVAETIVETYNSGRRETNRLPLP